MPRSGIPSEPSSHYRSRMTKFLSRYPDGAAGVALLLMRFSSALSAVLVLASLPMPTALSSLSIFLSAVVAIALVLGLATRTVAFALAVAAAAVVLAAGGGFSLAAQVCSCAALALLGPGAYSIDAKRFGRRVVTLEPRSPDRGSND